MDWTKLTEIFKAGTAVLFGIFLALTVLLFVPAQLIARLGVGELVASYRPWLGLSWLVVVSLLIARSLAALGPPISRKLEQFIRLRKGYKQLRNLTPGEKEFVARYLRTYSCTQGGSFESGVVRGLEERNIIKRSSSFSFYPPYFAYNIQSWAWEYILKNPGCLDLTDEIVAAARAQAEDNKAGQV